MKLLSQRFRALAADGDRGSVSLLAVVVAIGLIVMIGLVYDGGRALAAHERAAGIAGEAARAGANELDIEYLRATGIARLDPTAAQAAASNWIAAAGQDGTVTASTTEITVAIAIDTPAQLLAAVGIDTITVDAEATARPRVGVTTPFGGSP
jgi:Flp pilus assembly protein TadG